VQLDYVVRGNHAMFFVGKEKGYFAQNNIDLTNIQKGTGSPNAMRLVGNGNAELGFGDLPTLAVARSQDVPVVALVAVNQNSPLAMLALASKHKLAKPQDLKGLNIGVQPSGSTYVFLRAFLAANGMTLDDIKQSTVTPPYENYLLLGRVDAVPGYIDAEVPELEAKAGGPGSLSIMLGSDFGSSTAICAPSPMSHKTRARPPTSSCAPIRNMRLSATCWSSSSRPTSNRRSSAARPRPAGSVG
jgi:NitT/TauT family transport system substrate-binding protein